LTVINRNSAIWTSGTTSRSINFDILMLMFKLGGIKAGLRPSPSLISYAILTVCLFGFLLWRLAGLLPGISAPEAASRSASDKLHGLLSDPVNAPYRLVQHLLSVIHPGFFSLRFGSSIFAVIIALFFYGYVRRLFGRIIGLFGALLLISLPFFAISARQGTPQIMLFLPAVLIYAYASFIKSKEKTVAWLLMVAIVGIGLYTPGVIWWVAGAAALSYKKLSAQISTLPGVLSGLGIGLLCLAITPLVVICGLHLSALRFLLAVPSDLPTFPHFAAELLRMVGALAVKSPGGSPLLLDELPILNITLAALVIFGGYALYSAARGKAISLGLNVVMAVILAALNSNVAFLALAVPALIISAAAGLRYLYVEWRSIFPRNPVPKTFALALIAAVALGQLYYSADYTLRAWPHSPAIRQAYVLK